MAKSSVKKENQPLASSVKVALDTFVERAYLDYSMYVVLDRALPSICDGLKPVQRRIAYAMMELGLGGPVKPKKSARTIGDVIGKYHPHGDSACYEAMVLMAQPFASRYPLIQGQGNWGSFDDPKSFAAMRYTEAKLTEYAAVLLDEIGQGTVTWRSNFDGTLQEPEILPAKLPNVLLNGASGIAIGMSTDIPPHNLSEVCKACIRLLAKPRSSLDELLEDIPGPDFPGGGEIVNPIEEIRDIYEAGNGSLRLRASYEIEKKREVVITALPYQVSSSRVMNQFGELARNKKLPFVKDLRDESDEDAPVRLVIIPAAKVAIEDMMNHLFVHTDLERNYRVSFNMIGTDIKPQIKPLKQLLSEWIAFRKETVQKRLQWRLSVIDKRLEILEGFRIVYLDLDQVIRIVREEDKPKEELMKVFRLSEIQVHAILELRLRQLAKLEQLKIEQEYNDLMQEKQDIEACLKSSRRIKTLIKKELQLGIKKHGDARRTKLIEKPQARAMEQTEYIAAEPVTIILSRMGWVRIAKGHDVVAQELSYRSGDAFLASVLGNRRDTAIFLDSSGRCYTLAVHTLPSARGHGEPLSSRLKLPDKAHFIGMEIVQKEAVLVMASSLGYALRVAVEQTMTRSRAGKQVLNPGRDGEAVAMMPLGDLKNTLVAAVTSGGYLLLVDANEIPLLSKGKGNKLINIPKLKRETEGELLSTITCLEKRQGLTIRVGNRAKNISWDELAKYQGKRGQRGTMLPKLLRKVSSIQATQVR